MKARIRATGDIYNVVDMNDYRNRFKLEDNNWYTMGEIELIEGNEPDWQHYRIKAAIAAMQGMIISDAYCSEEPVGPAYQIKRRKWAPARIVQEAVAYADFLIAELQKKGGQNDSNND